MRKKEGERNSAREGERERYIRDRNSEIKIKRERERGLSTFSSRHNWFQQFVPSEEPEVCQDHSHGQLDA